jgi:hypothetical protein
MNDMNPSFTRQNQGQWERQIEEHQKKLAKEKKT